MRRFWLAVIALLLLYGGVAVGNYAATVGAGTNFGSVVIAGVHFASQLVCDFTTANQCASVSASNALKVDGSASTQPVSGTVTANAGTNLNTSTLATSANQTNGTQQSKITDGASIVAVKAASTASAAADISFVTNESPNSQISTTTGLKADAHSCSSASIIACLGQLDDDVKGPIPAGTNVIGALTATTNGGAATVKGGVATVSGGSRYQAVAASQTAAVLQAVTGAAGDYLSHCVIYPASTSPGAVTVFDGSNTAPNSAILFVGGATSVSNLAPIAVPVGAISRNGSWQVTTGAAVSVVCYGSFS